MHMKCQKMISCKQPFWERIRLIIVCHVYVYIYTYKIFEALIYKIIICHTVKYDSGGLPNATFLDNTHEMIIVFVWLCRFRSRILFNVPIICPYYIRYIESKATHCCFVSMIFSSQELFYHLEQLISL